jgi:UPF0755 protein
MARILRSFVGAILGVVLIAALAVGAWGYKQWQALQAPLGSQAKSLEVPRGTSFYQLVSKMADQRLVEDPAALKLYSKLRPEVRNLKAGEYAITPEDSTLSILDRIVRGAVMQHAVTLPEGWNIKEIAAILESAGIAEAAEFIALTKDPQTVAQYGIEGDSLEGYLFPDTYHFARGLGAAGVIKAMITRFRQAMPPDFEAKAGEFGLTAHQAVILASIIEKETGDKSERNLISAVFHNRLKKKMRLQSDPTVIYGIVDYDGNIRKRDLQTTTPYNTYRINGLPKGPIANPGREALLAVIQPAQVGYLYFVSKNDGTHYFSSTLVEHNRAVELYQKSLLRKKKK